MGRGAILLASASTPCTWSLRQTRAAKRTGNNGASDNRSCAQEWPPIARKHASCLLLARTRMRP
eukprot:2971774-Alexandrium_andersonii.AAC.1